MSEEPISWAQVVEAYAAWERSSSETNRLWDTFASLNAEHAAQSGASPIPSEQALNPRVIKRDGYWWAEVHDDRLTHQLPATDWWSAMNMVRLWYRMRKS